MRGILPAMSNPYDVSPEQPPSPQSLADLAGTTDWPLPERVAVVALEYREDQHQLPSVTLGRDVLVDLESSTPCLVVANPTTGANHFHLLRRQAKARPRRPLVVFTPKQLLRLKAAASPVEAFTQGGFQEVIPDTQKLDGKRVERVILVSGRLYYDLEKARQKAEDDKVAILRVEQLYPLPTERIKEELAKYPNAALVWAQDEPGNQGPWPFIGINLAPELDRPLTLASRHASAATSTGSHKRHEVEQAQLLQEAFRRG